MGTKVLLSVVLILIVSLYVQYYSKYNKKYEIVQASLRNITLDLLYERNPIIIEDTIANPRHLLKTLFKYSYTFVKEMDITTNNIFKIKSKFCLVYAVDTNTPSVQLNLINPIYNEKSKFKWKTSANGLITTSIPLNETNVEYITLKLKPNQPVIIPTHWLAQTDHPLRKIDLDDPVSCLCLKFSAQS
jgi:hypothetical protein